MLETPGDVFSNAYQWGQDTFDEQAFAENVAAFGRAVGLPVAWDRVPPGLFTVLTEGASSSTTSMTGSSASRCCSRSSARTSSPPAWACTHFRAPRRASRDSRSCRTPMATLHETLAITDNVSIVFEGGVDAAGGIGILVRPDRGVEAFASLLSPPSQAAAALALGIVVQGAGGEPVVLAGSREASRLEIRSASVRGGVRAATASGIDGFAEIGLQGGKIVIKPASGDSDSFLASLLPADGLAIDLALTVGLSRRQGIYFGGSSGLEIQLPAHIRSGRSRSRRDDRRPPRDGAIPIELGATIKGELGPLQAVVENIGLTRRR